MPCEALSGGQDKIDQLLTSLADWVKTGQNPPCHTEKRKVANFCNLVLEAHFPSISSCSSAHLQGSISAAFQSPAYVPP